MFDIWYCFKSRWTLPGFVFQELLSDCKIIPGVYIQGEPGFIQQQPVFILGLVNKTAPQNIYPCGTCPDTANLFLIRDTAPQ